MQKGPGGHTFREHYAGLAERGDANAKRRLREAANIPRELKYLHDWFVELDEKRGFADGVPLPISFVELTQWMEAVDAWPAPHEVRALNTLDRIRRHAMLKHMQQTRGTPTKRATDAERDDVETFKPSPRKRLAAAKAAKELPPASKRVAVVKPSTRGARRT